MATSSMGRATVLFALLILLESLASHGSAQASIECLSTADCSGNHLCRLGACIEESVVHNARRISNSAGSVKVKPPFSTLTREEVLNAFSQKTLSLEEKLDVIHVARQLFGEIHPHRNLHLSLLGIDPVAQLDHFEREVRDAQGKSGGMTDREFHEGMIGVFQLVDDLHASYKLPTKFATIGASLPFTVRDVYEGMNPTSENNTRKFVLTEVEEWVELPENSGFKPGSEIVTWNGVSINKAVEETGKSFYAANSGSRLRYGIALLTRRPLILLPIPETASVDVGYVDENGKKGIATFDWIFADAAGTSSMMGLTSRATDLQNHKAKEVVRQYGHRLFDFELNSTEHAKVRERENRLKVGERMQIDVNPAVQHLLSAAIIGTASGNIGFMKIRSFNMKPTELVQYSRECARIYSLMPSTGVAIDVRGNMGGLVLSTYATILPATKKKIEGYSFALRATDLNRRLSTVLPQNETGSPYESFKPSLLEALRIGDGFSAPIAPDAVSILGDENTTIDVVYDGPLIVLTDGITYSAGDIFAGIVKDNDLALVVGVDDSTGGGGSTTLSYNSEMQAVWPSVFAKKLPQGIDMTTSVLRIYRTGPKVGQVIEFFGVKPDVRYYPTMNDRFNNDADLFEYLGNALVQRGMVDNMAASSASSGTSHKNQIVLRG